MFSNKQLRQRWGPGQLLAHSEERPGLRMGASSMPRCKMVLFHVCVCVCHVFVLCACMCLLCVRCCAQFTVLIPGSSSRRGRRTGRLDGSGAHVLPHRHTGLQPGMLQRLRSANHMRGQCAPPHSFNMPMLKELFRT